MTQEKNIQENIQEEIIQDQDKNEKIYDDINDYLLERFFPDDISAEVIANLTYAEIRVNTTNILQELIDSLKNNRMPNTPDYLSKSPNDMLLCIYAFLNERDMVD